ncbi:MAG TPA: helix-turn-helix transcriptional regulator [Chloroflexia bacterium]|jgi:transcriptional regulator with XRE-family HTH domain
MPTARDDLRLRNEAIGAVLREAREKRNLTLVQAAAYLQTSRQRYAQLESGQSYLHAVEMIALVQYYGLNAQDVWPELRQEGTVTHHVVVKAGPGERVQVTIDMQESS